MSDDEVPRTVITGEHTRAVIFLPEEEIEDGLREQVQMMVDHPAMENELRIMSDAHRGAGGPIGLTAKLHNRVVPNLVGVDQGCGMEAVKLGLPPELSVNDKESLLWIDEQIRDAVPMGRHVHDWDDDNYHMGEDFPYDEFKQKWTTFAENHLDDDIELGEYHPDEFEPDVEWFKDLCDKVHYDPGRASNSQSTLGSGNHFVELAVSSESGEVWAVIHSGSRGLGMAIAEYHQNRAQKLRSIEEAKDTLRALPDHYLDYVKFDLEETSDKEVLDWLQGGMGESFVNYWKLKDDYGDTEPEKIEEIGNELKRAIPDDWGDDALAYLEDEEAVEYYVDLAFGQTYALENRRGMAELVAEALDADITDRITAVHNYIDYEDGVIRKGATPARDGERAVVPMNMSDGTFVVRGRGNGEWNRSAPHGAGRVMSRTQAFDELDREGHEARMGETFATELPTDEHPDAYKDIELIKEMIAPTAEIIDHLDPVLNIKAPE